MFVARDQENLIHAQQTAAISKPLNQSNRQLQPKTPANKGQKTPFKGKLNDENNVLTFGAGKQGLTGRRNQNGDGGKPGLGDKPPLVTPMGPRNRAPLGVKTTNAKANMFQTPSHPLGTIKQAKTGRRPSTLRKVKKASQSAPTTQSEYLKPEVEEDDPEIEYMPPKPQPLPDHDGYITYNTNFPQFKGRNFARGWNRIYEDNEVGKDGLTRKEREWKEQQAVYDKRMDDLIKQQVENLDLGIDGRESHDETCVEEVRQERRKKPGKMDVHRQVSTSQSRSAAKALSQQPKSTIPVKTKARAPSRTGIISSLAPQRRTPVPSNPSSMRHTAAIASSKTTLGYSKGRGISSTLRDPTSRQHADRPSSTNSSILSPERYMEVYGPPPFGTEMWSRCNAAGYFDPDVKDTEEKELQEETPPVYEEDEETANFQLTL